MAVKRNGTSVKYMLLHNGVKLKKGYHNGTKEIWSAGSTVTYIVDTGKTYTEEVDYGATCLSPSTFTPAKSGWTFIGWREDTVASENVLSSKSMESEPITLHAVFKQDITCTFVSRNSNEKVIGTRHYNGSGNTVNASVTCPNGAAYTDYSWRGWAAKGQTDADSAVAYTNGSVISNLESGGMYYGLYQKEIVLTTVVNGSSTQYKDLQYHCSAGFNKNPKFTVANPTVSGYSFVGWSSREGVSAVLYETLNNTTISTSTTLYAYLVETTKSFGYTGGIQSFTAPIDGIYKLVCYGAQGGTYRNVGGYGGYAYGNVALTKGQTIYVVVGGVPYNGGGNCTGAYASKGGGATHMAKRTGLLSTLDSYRSDVIIVAGGGGGGGDYGTGGTGGGTSGGNGNGAGGGRGATQTTGYAFGKARDEAGDNNICGGGGGYFGGYEGQDTVEDSSDTGGGGGGSGYVGGCISGTTGMTNGQKSGNGSASITFVSAS